MKLILALFIFALVGAVSFGFTALLVYAACWAFAFTFTWKIAFGVWAVLLLVRGIFSVTVTNKK